MFVMAGMGLTALMASVFYNLWVERNHLLAMTIFFFYTVFLYVFTLFYLYPSEIKPEEYRKLANYVEQGKLSKKQIDEAMSDDRITDSEYKHLVEPLKKKNEEAEMSNAKQQLRNATKEE